MTKQRTQKALINIEYKVAKPFVDAGALGLGLSAFAVVLQGPALNWAFLGGGFSLVWYWIINNLTVPRRPKSRQTSQGLSTVVLNSANGSRKVSVGGNFEYAPYQPGQISRETWGGTFSRLIWGKDATPPRPVSDSPQTVAREFVFYSHYEGKPVELREDDVRRFLRAAWKHRQRGRGLSQRRWVREWRERPQWYKDLPPTWYFALLVLLREAQQIRKSQLVVCTGHQQYQLARDPHITLALLREAAIQKGHVQPDAPLIEDTEPLIIGRDGVNSF